MKIVTGLERAVGWSTLHANNSRRTLGSILGRAQRERTCREPAKHASQVRLAIVQRDDKWEAMMSELGKDAKIPNLWRMSALLEICPKDVKEQRVMRLDEIGENHENLKAKVVSYTTNKTRGARNACSDGGFST